MSERITEKDLEGVCRTINQVQNLPVDGYANGRYHIESAYGGHKLSKFVGESGGTTSITGGYIPKKELYYRMHSFLDGLMAAKN